jgi:hypothetical protein
VDKQFHGILQYRNIRTGEYFAQSAHDSAKVMERMAVKTKQETVSMHSITILTLIFLPGTFLAVCRASCAPPPPCSSFTTPYTNPYLSLPYNLPLLAWLILTRSALL